MNWGALASPAPLKEKISAIIIFVYLIADILRNLTLLTSTTQGGTHNSHHTGQRYIQKG